MEREQVKINNDALRLNFQEACFCPHVLFHLIYSHIIMLPIVGGILKSLSSYELYIHAILTASFFITSPSMHFHTILACTCQFVMHQVFFL